MISLDGFWYWIRDIQIWHLVLILLFPAIMDYCRSLGKILFLVLYKIKKIDTIPNDSYFCVHDKKITILIPAHNEETDIRKSIDAALNTFYPNKEIIVIDDSSTDDTYKIAKEYADKNLIKLVYLNGGSKSAALNHGYLHATGQIIVSMDADTCLEKHSLEKIARNFDNASILAISGNIKVPTGDDGISNMLTRLQKYEYLLGIDFGRRYSSLLNSLLVISGAFGVFRCDAFNHAGRFSQNAIGEDFDLSLKIHKLGGKIIFAEKAVGNTLCPNSWTNIFRQRRRWGYGQMQTLLKHRDVLSSRYRAGLRLAVLDMWIMDVMMNFVSIFGMVLLGVFVILPNLEALENLAYLFSLIFLIYFVAELSVFLYTVKISSNKECLKLIYLIPIMMFVYRPLMKLVTIKGHLDAIFGSKIQW